MMRLHVAALAHTQTTAAFSTCAYTAKVRNFCRMMHDLGHEVMLYAGEQNDVPCAEHIVCLSEAERQAAVGSGHYTSASFDGPHWRTFNAAAIAEIGKRAQPHDFICLIAGIAQQEIADAFPAMISVEFGVGYGGWFAKFKVFESYAWMHTCYGARSNNDPHGIDGQWFDAVIPGYLDPEMFPVNSAKQDYLLYVGRMIDRKGIQIAADVAKACGRELITAGPGTPPAGVTHLGEIGPEQRAKVMGEARALLAPSHYIEPFGNVVIEAMACGTPVITTDWGAFCETVVEGVTGFRCRMFGEFMDAVKNVDTLDSHVIAAHARAHYSLSVIAQKYDRYFRRLETLWQDGWYADASANANTLDDYEEGTWTPTMEG